MNKKYWLIGCDFYFENNGDRVVSLYNGNGCLLNYFTNIREYKDFNEHLRLCTRVMHDLVYGMPSRMRQELQYNIEI